MSAVKRINDVKAPRFQWRGWLLYILPLPLLPAAIIALMTDHTMAAIARAIGFALAMFAATLIRKGIQLQIEGQQRRFKRRASTLPYRMIGAAVLAFAMFVVANWGIFNQNYSMFDSLLFALAVLLGCYLYYEFDPAQKDPKIAAVGITTEELIELLDEAEERIGAIEQASKDINNVEFRDRLKRIVREARAILDTIEEDPVDARRARKFLKVYLDGAKQVTEGYVRVHRNEANPVLEDNFRRVLITIETVIAEQQEKLRENNTHDLDVNIEVLQMQLEKEGIS
jgi:5-bromo-4-chloroindolyl phosphate hydrolysis protein